LIQNEALVGEVGHVIAEHGHGNRPRGNFTGAGKVY
jgi:hypothetical protein